MRRRGPGTGCACAALALLATLPAFAADPAPDAPSPPAAETLDFTPDPSRLTLPVHIGASGPYRFVVDTGAERTIISAGIASRLALAPGRPLRIATVAGSAIVPTALIPKLSMSRSRALTDVTAPVLDAAHIGADGMLGIDALSGRSVVFDFGARAMTITASARREAEAPGDIVVTARAVHGRMILGEGRVERTRTAIVVDTGAEVTIANEALRRALAARRRLPPVLRGEVVTITGERMPVDLVVVQSLDLGGVALRAMPIAFAPAPVFAQIGLQDRPALLLGMDALRLFDRVAVDFRARRVRFRP